MDTIPTRLVQRCLAAVLISAAGTAAAYPPAENSPSENGRPTAAPVQRRVLTLSDLSWTYQAKEEPKELRINDLLEVVVDYKSEVISEGEMDRRKKVDGNFALKNWIAFDGGGVEPDKQTAGDPTITGEMQTKYRAEAELETRNSMKLRIQCRVVDIRPNGNLVVEGRRAIYNNEDSWEVSLIGTIRPEDVLPDNSILSENIADLRIVKRETGHIRDGWRRGWFKKIYDRFQPF